MYIEYKHNLYKQNSNLALERQQFNWNCIPLQHNIYALNSTNPGPWSIKFIQIIFSIIYIFWLYDAVKLKPVV